MSTLHVADLGPFCVIDFKVELENYFIDGSLAAVGYFISADRGLRNQFSERQDKQLTLFNCKARSQHKSELINCMQCGLTRRKNDN